MTQKQRILEFLQSGRILTRLNSWDELGVIEAPARISELRQEGCLIETRMVEIKNRYQEVVRVAQWYMPEPF